MAESASPAATNATRNRVHSRAPRPSLQLATKDNFAAPANFPRQLEKPVMTIATPFSTAGI